MEKRVFAFGSFMLYSESCKLFAGDRQIVLGQRAINILSVLVEQNGRLVSYDELVAAVWPGTIVEANNLRVQMTAIRKALRGVEPRVEYVVNVPRRGYRFVAEDLHETTQRESRSHRLKMPTPLVEPVGRSSNELELTSVLARQRMVSIVGGGGVGKTTLAVSLASRIGNTYRDGVCMLDLSSATACTDLVATLGNALQVGFIGGRQSEPLEYLRHRRLLLVVDNCEHVIETASKLIELILTNAPEVKVLATSRVLLRVRSEFVYRLPPLTYQSSNASRSAESASLLPAAQLFCRAAAATSGGRSIEATESALLRICKALGGNPLALELAASRFEGLELPYLAERLESDEALRWLNRGRRTAPLRHQTFGLSLDWSFGLLSPYAQRVLVRLAAFAGWFTREGVIAVAKEDGYSQNVVDDVIEDLISASMLVVSEGPRRLYRLEPLTRVYGMAKLDSDAQRDDVRRRHAEYLYEIVREGKFQRDIAPGFASERSAIGDMKIALRWCASTTGDASLGMRLLLAAMSIWTKLGCLEEYAAALVQGLAFHNDPQDARSN